MIWKRKFNFLLFFANCFNVFWTVKNFTQFCVQNWSADKSVGSKIKLFIFQGQYLKKGVWRRESWKRAYVKEREFIFSTLIMSVQRANIIIFRSYVKFLRTYLGTGLSSTDRASWKLTHKKYKCENQYWRTCHPCLRN